MKKLQLKLITLDYIYFLLKINLCVQYSKRTHYNDLNYYEHSKRLIFFNIQSSKYNKLIRIYVYYEMAPLY